MLTHTIYRVVLSLVLMSFSCIDEAISSSVCQSPAFPRWTFEESHVFPQARGLSRPEDGKALPDGRLVVADESHGLRLIDPEGSHRPFGQFVKAGYVHTPPEPPGGLQAVFLEQDSRYLLVGDIYTGKIYRVDVETEQTKLIYDHPYGINSVYRDRRGRSGSLSQPIIQNNVVEKNSGLLWTYRYQRVQFSNYGDLGIRLPKRPKKLSAVST